MPLHEGRSQAVISANIRELIHKYDQTGKIGNIKPRNRAHALEIAKAIAEREARGGESSGKKGRAARQKGRA